MADDALVSLAAADRVGFPSGTHAFQQRVVGLVEELGPYNNAVVDAREELRLALGEARAPGVVVELVAHVLKLRYFVEPLLARDGHRRGDEGSHSAPADHCRARGVHEALNVDKRKHQRLWFLADAVKDAAHKALQSEVESGRILRVLCCGRAHEEFCVAVLHEWHTGKGFVKDLDADGTLGGPGGLRAARREGELTHGRGEAAHGDILVDAAL
mmetsp:Transcript_19541/g.57662  ORF Transcript_19541/g.57662 Transcript_19541/m.57662 type:complete len:214 (-) Transcript_19541:72-713(-)